MRCVSGGWKWNYADRRGSLSSPPTQTALWDVLCQKAHLHTDPSALREITSNREPCSSHQDHVTRGDVHVRVGGLLAPGRDAAPGRGADGWTGVAELRGHAVDPGGDRLRTLVGGFDGHALPAQLLQERGGRVRAAASLSMLLTLQRQFVAFKNMTPNMKRSKGSSDGWENVRTPTWMRIYSNVDHHPRCSHCFSCPLKSNVCLMSIWMDSGFSLL